RMSLHRPATRRRNALRPNLGSGPVSRGSWDHDGSIGVAAVGEEADVDQVARNDDAPSVHRVGPRQNGARIEPACGAPRRISTPWRQADTVMTPRLSGRESHRA